MPREYNPRPLRPCGACGKLFPVPNNRLAVARFCSRACRSTTRSTAVCQNCGESFYAKPTYLRQGHAKYCSKACAYAVAHPWSIFPCDYCGIAFKCRRRLVALPVKFCSAACAKASGFPGDPAQFAFPKNTHQPDCRCSICYRPPKPLEERFWAKVNKTATCWLWTGAKAKNGYGLIQEGGRGLIPFYAHRYSYELNVGPIPEGLFVLHNCPGGDNRLCVNPAHLRPGTHAENMYDASVKGRMRGRPSPSLASESW